MGYVSVIGTCIGCGQPFSFHPNKVPSIRIRGVRREICAACVAAANPRRIANGLAPIVVLPGAYAEADEAEVAWDEG